MHRAGSLTLFYRMQLLVFCVELNHQMSGLHATASLAKVVDILIGLDRPIQFDRCHHAVSECLLVPRKPDQGPHLRRSEQRYQAITPRLSCIENPLRNSGKDRGGISGSHATGTSDDSPSPGNGMGRIECLLQKPTLSCRR